MNGNNRRSGKAGGGRLEAQLDGHGLCLGHKLLRRANGRALIIACGAGVVSVRVAQEELVGHGVALPGNEPG